VIYDSGLFEIKDRVAGVRYFGVDAARIAQGLGSPQVANVVMLGALSETAHLFALGALGCAVTERFPKAATINLKALQAGAQAVKATGSR
jgi:Pyruvate/2-oxoacid:ferredoxin oxidoreductase gamma subunit